jgi:GNAT superfamily N-acetyltransferase
VSNTVIRAMRADDMGDTFAVRTSVAENALTLEQLERMGITPESVAASLHGRARGWVAEKEGVVVAFAIADGETRSIFALFVAPGYEGRGLGSALLDRAVGNLADDRARHACRGALHTPRLCRYRPRARRQPAPRAQVVRQ